MQYSAVPKEESGLLRKYRQDNDPPLIYGQRTVRALYARLYDEVGSTLEFRVFGRVVALRF